MIHWVVPDRIKTNDMNNQEPPSIKMREFGEELRIGNPGEGMRRYLKIEAIGLYAMQVLLGCGEWNLSELLVRNRVSARNQKRLLERGLTAQTFISWLLYAASPGGSGIRDPTAHAVSRLISDPTSGAGGAFDQLAGLPAKEVASLLIRELRGQSPPNQTWRKEIEGSPHSRLRALADQLSVQVPE